MAAASLLHACHFSTPGATGNEQPRNFDEAAGSAGVAPPGTESSPSTDADPAQSPGTEPAQPPGAGTAQQPASESSPVISGGILLPNGLLPDGGYSHPSAPDRYYDNTVHELIPSTGYGRIWPYIGGYTMSNMGTWSYHIGICDDAGRIICDPAYNDVSFIVNGGHKLYTFTKNEVNRNGGRYEDTYPTTIAAVDGSWAETYECALWAETSSYEYSPPLSNYYGDSRCYQWRDAVSYDYITARRGGLWGVVDWDGSVLLPFEYIEPVCFYEGLASVLSDNGATYSFIDITGRTRLGPFEAPPRPVDEWDFTGAGMAITNKIAFHEGYAKFYRNGKFGIIDRTGRIAVPAVYDFITCMNGGMAMFVTYGNAVNQQSLQERFGIVNSTGAVIVAPTDYNYGYYHIPEYVDGHVVIREINNPAGDMIAFDGSKTPYEDDSPNYSSDGKYYIFRNSDVKLSLDRYLIEYAGADWIMATDRDNWTWQIYDYSGNPVSSENPGRLDHWYYNGRNVEYLFINVSPPGVWEWPPPLKIYSLDGSALFEGVYYTIKPIDDRFMVRGKTSAGLIGKDGNFIIEVDVTAYGAD